MVNLTEDSTHPGDVRAWLGYGLFESPGRQIVLRTMVELPTGRVKDLSGSGATDVAAWLELVDARWLRAVNTTLTLMAGVTAAGEGDLMPDRQRRPCSAAIWACIVPSAAG